MTVSKKIVSDNTGEIFSLYSGITNDNRDINPGEVFVAVQCDAVADHSLKAVREGAAAILLSSESLEAVESVLESEQREISLIISGNLDADALRACDAIFGKPHEKMDLIGITGTNGKTTIAHIMQSALKSLGRDAARIGTTGYLVGGVERPAPNTTPDSVKLRRLLSQAHKSGDKATIMEVSSHALTLGRVGGLEFKSAGFTNLSRDHLDFHSDMEEYFQAKRKLFSMITDDGSAVVNTDDEAGKRLTELIKPEHILDYGTHGNERIFGRLIKNQGGLRVNLSFEGLDLEFKSQLNGSFNLYNLMCAFGLLISLGYSSDEAVSALSSASGAPGRMEKAASFNGADIYIDYAHTPDALRAILKDAGRYTSGRLFVVFGCGGNRDKGKRPLMGRVAYELSDIVVVTSDNPRKEEPSKILNDIVQGIDNSKKLIKNGTLLLIEDRTTAIQNTLDMCEKGDTVIIAGKGHEEYQEISSGRIHLSDRETVRQWSEND